MTIVAVDRAALEQKVKSMYSDVAAKPHGDFHFEMGRTMAERLGYASADQLCNTAMASLLDQQPATDDIAVLAVVRDLRPQT